MQICKLWRETEHSEATLYSWAERAVPLLCWSGMRNPPLTVWKSRLGTNCALIISKCSLPAGPRTSGGSCSSPP